MSEDIRSGVADLHKTEKRYKVISKCLAIHESTIRQVVYKWRQFSIEDTLLEEGTYPVWLQKCEHIFNKERIYKQQQKT